MSQYVAEVVDRSPRWLPDLAAVVRTATKAYAILDGTLPIDRLGMRAKADPSHIN